LAPQYHFLLWVPSLKPALCVLVFYHSPFSFSLYTLSWVISSPPMADGTRDSYLNAMSSALDTSIFFFLLLFICAYKAWVISPPWPHPLPYHPLHPLPLPPTPSIPSRNYFALISNFVVERV
jgi:hypothetical protein